PPPLGEPPTCKRKVPVTGLSQLSTAIGAAMPGDCVVLANGSYTSSGAISVTRAGTAQARITITAETIGGVTISGTGSFSLDSPAAYVVIRGFKFTNSGQLMMSVGTHNC